MSFVILLKLEPTPQNELTRAEKDYLGLRHPTQPITRQMKKTNEDSKRKAHEDSKGGKIRIKI